MADFDKEFWEAIAQNGPVPFEELPERINNVLADNPSWVQLPDTNTTVVYSGGYGGAGMTPAAQDLAARGGGTIGIIDETKTGQALGDMVDGFYSSASDFEANYSKYIDFDGYEVSNLGHNVGQFKSQLFKNFEPASSHFASHAKGNIITMTPASDVRRVYAQQEIPQIVDGMIDGRIAEVNGRSVAEFDELLKPFRDPNFKPSLDPDNYSYKAIQDQFDGDFRANIKSQGLDFHSDATRAEDGSFNRDAKRTVLDADQADMKNLGATDDVRVSTPDLDGLNSHDIHGLKAGRARLLAADELGELRGFAASPDGSVSHLIDTKTSTIYTLNGDDLTGVQKFDNSKEAGHAFGRMMGEAAQAHPDSFKGLPEVHSSLGSLGSHIDDLGRPAWRKALGAAGDTAAEFGGKATKILGPLGVAAAGAEVYGLEMKLQDYEKFGLVPEEAMLAYRANLAAHTAQATVDPTLVGGEAVVQGAHELWAHEFKIDDNVKEALAPGSLVKDVYSAKQWLDAQAMKAGMEVADYAKEVWNDPSKVVRDLESAGEAAWDVTVNAAEAVGTAAVNTAEAVGDYTASRWEEPERLLDDAAAAGSAIYNAPGRAWKALFGPDEPSSLERSLDAAGATPPLVPYEQAVQQFSDDRAVLRVSDPEASLPITQAANHPEAEAMFVRLSDAGIERFPAAALEGDKAQDRVGNVLVQAQEIDQDLQAERARDQSGVHNEHVQSYQAEDEYAYEH